MKIHRKILLSLLIAALLVMGVGAAVLVNAQDSQPGPDTGETEEEGGETESPASPSDAALTQDEAIAIAEAETGSTAAFVELENEGGSVIYSIELEDGSEVEVDANTGDILQVEGAGTDSD